MKHFRPIIKVLQRLTISAVSLLIALVLLEFLVLRLLDPLGIGRYHEDLDLMFQQTEPNQERGWIQKPGIYRLSSSIATVTDEGRVVPDTNLMADCTIAAIGDSATFGHGVDDEDTWVNLLARHYQQARFINAAVTGYNAENMQAAIQTLDANGYVYLIIANDAEPQLIWSEDWASPSSYLTLELYLRHIVISAHEQSTLKNPAPQPPDYPAFDARLQEILRYPVQAFVFDDPWALNRHVIKTFPQVRRLTRVTSVNSWADPHPDAVGHQQIADEMIPHLSGWIAQICEQ